MTNELLLPKFTMNLEKQLIKIIQETFPESQEFIGDDAALLDLQATKLAISTDNFIENVHFDKDIFSPYDIGWKALAVNLSDLAAMAAKPLYFLVTLALAEKSLGSNTQEAWVREFYTGLYDCAKAFGFPKLIGGDLSSAVNETAISITIIGEARAGNQLLRANARPGDQVCVSGKFGNSGSFFDKYQALKKQPVTQIELKSWLQAQWQSETRSDIEYHLRPRARIQEAASIQATRGALMDTSDGLAQALFEIAEQSKVSIKLDSGLIPKDPHVDLSKALFGGEDYELLACFEEIPHGFTKIGEIVEFSEIGSIIDVQTGKKLEIKDIFSHFN